MDGILKELTTTLLSLKCSEMGIGAVKRARGTRNIQMATSWCKKSLSLSTPVQPTVKHSCPLPNYGGWEEPCVLAHRRLCGKRGWAEEPHLPGGSFGGNEALPWAGPLGASSATHPEICFLLRRGVCACHPFPLQGQTSSNSGLHAPGLWRSGKTKGTGGGHGD